jgi:CBS domain-containing protein
VEVDPLHLRVLRLLRVAEESRLREVVSRDLVTALEGTSLEEVAKILIASKKSLLPLVKEGGLPACQNCGGSHMFEFQLLPQLLYYLGVQNETDTDSLDWATIAVYTCAASCNKSESSCEGYVEEFAWVQLAVT